MILLNNTIDPTYIIPQGPSYNLFHLHYTTTRPKMQEEIYKIVKLHNNFFCMPFLTGDLRHHLRRGKH